MITISTYLEFENCIKENQSVLAYFSHETCNVCKVLKPKVIEMLGLHFPLMKPVFIDTVKSPEIAGQCGVFAVPSIICYFDGKEGFRKSRNIGINELITEIKRPYEMLMLLD